MKKLTLPILAALAVVTAALLHRYAATPEQVGGERATPLWNDASFVSLLNRSGRRGAKGILVVAPSSGLKGQNPQKARDIADTLEIALPKEAVDPEIVPYTANDDETRFRLLAEGLRDPDAEVLWALRGGYGASRLLPALAAMPEPATRKVIVGYSDITFLHLFFQRWNWPTVHGAMFWELTGAGKGKSAENFRLLAALLAGETKELRYAGLTPCNDAARTASFPLRTVVRGGNLTCLAAAVGTPWSVDSAGAALFIEDVKERGYKLDRTLTQLRHAGVFDHAAAVVLGEFSQGDDQVDFALERFARECAKPVFRTDLFGHGEKNLPLVFNCPAVLEKDAGTGEIVLRIDTTPLFPDPPR